MDFTQVIIPAITGLITFFVGLRKGKAETESVVLQNLEKSISIYQTIIEDLREEIINLNLKVQQLQDKLDSMEKGSKSKKG